MQASGKNRILIHWNPQNVAGAVGNDSLVAARLEFSISDNGDNWGSTGRTIDLHRVTVSWTEMGATWNCAVDANTANQSPDCSGATLWAMDGPNPRPWASPPTATTLITNGLRGVVSFDVTTDVAAMLFGAGAHDGWIVNKTDEGANGRVEFGSRESTVSPHLILTLAPRSAQGGVPAVPPDSLPTEVEAELFAPENMVASHPEWGVPFPRNLILLTFNEQTTQPEKQAAIESIGGVVVGGAPVGQGGIYFVRINDDGTPDPLFQAIAALRLLPQVEIVTPDLGAAELFYLKPGDGPAWERATWAVTANAAAGQNWALEYILAPLAWGCTTGDSSRGVGVSDHGFQGLVDFQGNLDPASTSRFNQFPVDHGTAVASIIGARGNNGVGMTGVMWHTELFMAEFGGPVNQTPFARGISDIHRLIARGARVINISWGTAQIPMNVNLWAQIAGIYRDYLARVLRVTQVTGRDPLVVLASGNHGGDARFAGFPQVADSFPNNVIVVAASDDQGGLVQASGQGHLVSVAAPGLNVGALSVNGTVLPFGGTSAAAPFVSGLAGLLLSFDSSLTAAEVRTLIIDGAIAGNRIAGQYPIINAYRSLKLAAQRPGAPICGNRVWLDQGRVRVRRDSTTIENIAEGLGELNSMNIMHGGHRIDVFGQITSASIIHQGGAWQVVIPPPQDTTLVLAGVSFSPQGFSHDADSSATINQVTFNPNPTVRVNRSPGGALGAAFPGFVPDYAGCCPVGRVGWSSTANHLIVPVRQGSSGPVDLWRVHLTTGVRLLMNTLPANAFQIGIAISEDGTEFAVNYASTGSTCVLQYYSMTTGDVLDTQVIAPNPPPNVCPGKSAPGTFTPAPRNESARANDRGPSGGTSRPPTRR